MAVIVRKPHIIGPPASLAPSAGPDTAHAAASATDPSVVGWYPYAGSADADLSDDLDKIIPRSRDLARNNGYVNGVRQTLADNIIGSQLILASNPDSRLLGWERAQAKEWARLTESQFATWANDAYECDAGRALPLLELATMALSTWFLSGAAVVIPHWQPRPGARWNTRVQMIEPDRLETPPRYLTDLRVRRGVRLDNYGAAIGYYIRNTHPGDIDSMSAIPRYRYIPAFTDWGRRRIIHLFDRERPNQTHGKPLVTAVMREFRMATHYTRTELQATISNSLVAAFLKSNLSQDGAAELYGTTDIDTTNATWKQAISQWQPRLKGGAVIPLPPGAEIEAFQPNRPNQAFEAFMLSVLRNIAAGLNIPYELLAKDFSKTNYSSARAAMLEAWRYFHSRRRWMENHLLTPLYELWLEEAVNAGVIAAPGYYDNRFAYRRCTWTMSGRGWVDPQKEANAAGIRMQHNITTLRQECAEQGLDWEEVLEQRAEELRLMRTLGIPTSAPASDQIISGPSDQDAQPDQGEPDTMRDAA